MTDDLAAERRAQNAWREWHCPRPDKKHFCEQQHADEGLRLAATRHGEERPEAGTSVYRCPCGGWVWGRRHHPTEGVA